MGVEGLRSKIAGEIALSETPGGTMKKWREIFGITQAELGEFLHISASTISDYEGNRRKSPGIVVVRRFVEALLSLDKARGGQVAQKFSEEDSEKFFEVHEFASSIGGVDFMKLIKGKPIANEELLDKKKVYGYTLINSIKVILDLPSSDFPKLYGAMSERAFVFTEVSTGRSPMVVIRVSQMKPSIVVLHELNDKEVDKLALKIAQKEQIPVLTTNMPLDKIAAELKKL
ncbi:helix-turn-helix domain-containing protein [Candidatus Micrarchaeota archaeon]|nr:helix-turn-helix domain-containing protein [Candidatus Micrarchaeota archaeon]